MRDAGFESYVAANDPDLAVLQNLNTVTLPNGERIDFGHMLASMNLVYNGLPITGSWGGDCQQLAEQYHGQAGDAAGYAALMRTTFNMDDDGTLSKFSNQDLHADLDSVLVGAKITKDTDLAEALRSYYASLTEYDRAKEFITLSFGTVDTSAESFKDAVYSAPTGGFRYAAAVLYERYVVGQRLDNQGGLRPCRARRYRRFLPSIWPRRSTMRKSRARRMTVWWPWAARHCPMR